MITSCQLSRLSHSPLGRWVAAAIREHAKSGQTSAQPPHHLWPAATDTRCRQTRECCDSCHLWWPTKHASKPQREHSHPVMPAPVILLAMLARRVTAVQSTGSNSPMMHDQLWQSFLSHDRQVSTFTHSFLTTAVLITIKTLNSAILLQTFCTNRLPERRRSK